MEFWWLSDLILPDPWRGLFQHGVAVAPVTNWKYYDNIYTEKFMRTPKENMEGYESNSPINHADLLKGKLLIVHGMADDNVHPQNSYDFITALVSANKQFDQQFYPNCNHNIRSGKKHDDSSVHADVGIHLKKPVAVFSIKADCQKTIRENIFGKSINLANFAPLL